MGLSLKANGIYYADPKATEWGMQINELSMGKLEGGLAKVYEIYEESLKEGIGMVSLYKVEKDGLLIEGNSDRQPVRRQYRALDRRSGRRRGLVAQRPAAVRPVRGSRRFWRPAGPRR